MELADLASKGMHVPKGYDEEELDKDLLAWRLGGSRMVYANNHSKSRGGASLQTIKHHGKDTLHQPLGIMVRH